MNIVDKLKYGKNEYLKLENIIFANSRYKIITTAWLIFAAVFFMCNIVLIMQGLSDRAQQYQELIDESRISHKNNSIAGAIEENNGSTAVQVEKYTVFFDIKCEENLFLNKDDIDVFVDDAKIGRVPHGFEFTKFLSLSEGDHIVKFVSSSTSQRAIQVDEKATLKCDITIDFSELCINEFSLEKGISTNEEVLNSIPGTYYGFGESGLVLFDDYSAEYCMDYYDSVGTGGSWYYRDGKLYITLTKPQCKIYADVRDIVGNEKISIVADNPYTWGDEDFIKLSDEAKPLSVEEYKIVIKKGQELRKVTDVINSINSIGEVNLGSGGNITSARKLFEELDDDSKTHVTNYEVLENAEEAYRILEKDEVEKAISEIGDVTLESSTQINSVRNLYDEKTDDVKKIISNYDVLTKAEMELSRLRVQNVENILSVIDVDKITLDDADMVQSAEMEFNKLNSEEQALVENSNVIKDAVEKINELKEEEKKARTMSGTKLQITVDACKEYGVTEVYDEFFGHGTRCKHLSDSSGGLTIDIIYYTENNEIMCATIVTNKAVSSKTQRKFVKGITKYICPSSDASTISSWVNSNIGDKVEKNLNGFTYELSVGSVDNILYSAGEREWEKWESKQINPE